MSEKACETSCGSLIEVAARHAVAVADAVTQPYVQKRVALWMMDVIGAAMNALQTPFSKKVFSLPSEGANESSMIGRGFTTASDAAFANGALAHSFIREDMHLPSGSHIGVAIVPAVMAAIEREGRSGADLARGILAGYELAAVIGRAIRTGDPRKFQFRYTGITGPFGAAAGIGVGLDWDAEKIATAMTYAANMTVGVNEWAWAGSEEVFFHAGMAARNALFACELAQAGFRGANSTIEGKAGVLAAFGVLDRGVNVFENSLEGLSVVNEVKHKPVPGCNYVQTPVASALELRRREALNPQTIASVTIHTFTDAREYPGCDFSGPFVTELQSKMSLQYAVAAALVFGRVDNATYQAFDNQEVRRLIGNTTIVEEPEFIRAFPERQAGAVSVVLRDGDSKKFGYDDVPWLSDDGVMARFLHDSSTYLGLEQAMSLRDKILTMAFEHERSEIFGLLVPNR